MTIPETTAAHAATKAAFEYAHAEAKLGHSRAWVLGRIQACITECNGSVMQIRGDDPLSTVPLGHLWLEAHLQITNIENDLRFESSLNDEDRRIFTAFVDALRQELLAIRDTNPAFRDVDVA